MRASGSSERTQEAVDSTAASNAGFGMMRNDGRLSSPTDRFCRESDGKALGRSALSGFQVGGGEREPNGRSDLLVSEQSECKPHQLVASSMVGIWCSARRRVTCRL